MSQVIVYTQANGQVAVCVPTGELHINDVLAKDCPAGAIIVDDSTLPQGNDAQFFDAWRLNGSTVSVDMPTAINVANTRLNQMAYAEAQHRSAKVGAGLTNVESDTAWATTLSTARTAITGAKTTTDLVNAITPVQQAITANAL